MLAAIAVMAGAVRAPQNVGSTLVMPSLRVRLTWDAPPAGATTVVATGTPSNVVGTTAADATYFDTSYFGAGASGVTFILWHVRGGRRGASVEFVQP